MEERLLEVQERFKNNFDNIFIEADCIIIEDSFEDTGCKNDDDCCDQALENANMVREIFPDMEVVSYYCHRHKYAVAELRFLKYPM